MVSQLPDVLSPLPFAYEHQELPLLEFTIRPYNQYEQTAEHYDNPHNMVGGEETENLVKLKGSVSGSNMNKE